jgi:PAS domain-containing protein
MIKENKQTLLLQNLERLGNISKTGYWEYEIAINELYWSEMVKEIHEVPKSYVPLVAESINFCQEGTSRELMNGALEKAIHHSLPFDITVQISTLSGKIKWVRSIGHLKQKWGKATRIYGTIQDIDATKGQEIKLQSLNDRLEIATKVMNIGIWEIDLNANTYVWDDRMHEIFDIKKEGNSTLYKAWENSLHPKDRARTILKFEAAVREHKDFSADYRIIKPSGIESYIKADASFISDDQGAPLKYIGTCTDITVKTVIDEQLKGLYFQNKNQNKFLTNFAHTITHNLRSSSGNLSMIIGLLKEDTSTENKALFLDMMEQATNRLEDTIAQLNETVSIKFGEKKSTTKININDAIRKATENINALIGNKKAKINVTVPNDLIINGYQSYFESIFQNFLTNSLKYAREGVAPIINIKAEAKEDSVTIQVSDNGMGIDLEKHGDQIFEMYKTFHGNKDAKGIGLFLTKEQIEAMGGTISLESTPGKGTTFIVKFKF